MPSGVMIGGARPSADAATTQALPALIGRLQELWTRAPARLRSGLGTNDKRGGDDLLPDERDSSSCTSQTACLFIGKNESKPYRVEDEESDQQRTCNKTRCEVDETEVVSRRPRRGEER
jgi:hypothetical protein